MNRFGFTVFLTVFSITCLSHVVEGQVSNGGQPPAIYQASSAGATARSLPARSNFNSSDINLRDLEAFQNQNNLEPSKKSQDFLTQTLDGKTATGEPNTESDDAGDLVSMIGGGPEQWTKPKKLSASIQVMVLLTVLTLAPSILLMTTCFVRVIVVLGLLRQAIGAQQLPPSQVITALSIFITILVMAPVWNEIKNDAVLPYTQQEGTSVSLEDTINRGVRPLKRFMSQQIAMARNVDDIWLFFKHLPEEERQNVPKTFADVPFKVLLPAYMISELKVAFLLGFQIYLPFLVIDIVVSSIAISMGMMMLPPVIISLPFKLILFVLVDGWHLVVGMLMSSFTPYS